MTDVIDYRLDVVEKDVGEIKDAIKSIAGSLQTLTRLEERHQETREALNKSFQTLQEHDQRIRKLEVEAPTTRLIRAWVISAMTGAIALVFLAVAQKSL